MLKLGYVQIALSVVLFVCACLAWIAYQSSIGGVILASSRLPAEAAGLATTCHQQLNDTKEVAKTVRAACASTQVAVDAMRASYMSSKQYIPKLREKSDDLEAFLARASLYVRIIGKKMNVAVPAGIHMKGWIPALSWSYPLSETAAAAINLAQELEEAQAVLELVNRDVLGKMQSSNDPAIDALNQTITSLKLTDSALERFSRTTLPAAGKALDLTGEQLQAASYGIGQAGILVNCVVLTIMAMAAVFFVNGLIVTRLALHSIHLTSLNSNVTVHASSIGPIST